jgi:hypothetical protein
MSGKFSSSNRRQLLKQSRRQSRINLKKPIKVDAKHRKNQNNPNSYKKFATHKLIALKCQNNYLLHRKEHLQGPIIEHIRLLMTEMHLICDLKQAILRPRLMRKSKLSKKDLRTSLSNLIEVLPNSTNSNSNFYQKRQRKV